MSHEDAEKVRLGERIEHDLLGERRVPASAYWGIHTLRAAENFTITDTRVEQKTHLIVALACVKQAAAEANVEHGLLERRVGAAIAQACEEIRAGRLHEYFVVDQLQGGAGTSTNMNANEVIANRALEVLGEPRGSYAIVHPNEHVNRSQSTNDVYPTAVRIALIWGAERLIESLGELSTVFVEKADEFSDVLKIGRTQLQDAVPMTLGQELRVYAVMLDEDIQRLEEASLLLHEINFGGTAIGTGITASRSYADTAQRNLARITELPLVPALDLIEATQDTGALVSFSATLKRIAVKLSKTCNDLRLLSSGPRAGFGELLLPPVQAGSSLMPGKVNPVIPEVVSQVAFEVVGHDVTVTMAAEAGQLQLNAFGPVMYRCISESLEHLTAACQVLSRRCVSGLQANREVLQARVNASIATVTALAGVVGYEAATKIATEALASGRRVADLVVECGLLGPEEADRILRPESMVSV